MAYIFFKSLLVGYSGAVMPGSLLTYTINQSLKKGWIAGLLVFIGHALLELLLITLLFFGLKEFLGSDMVAMVIGFIGGLFLAAFGAFMIKDAVKNRLAVDLKKPAAPEKSKYGIIPAGAVVSASNPYFIIWWAGIGLGLLNEAYLLFGTWGIVVFTAGHFLADLSWYLFVSLLIDKSRRFISPKAYRIVGIVLGVIIIGFGIYFIIQAAGFLRVIVA